MQAGCLEEGRGLRDEYFHCHLEALMTAVTFSPQLPLPKISLESKKIWIARHTGF